MRMQKRTAYPPTSPHVSAKMPCISKGVVFPLIYPHKRRRNLHVSRNAHAKEAGITVGETTFIRKRASMYPQMIRHVTFDLSGIYMSREIRRPKSPEYPQESPHISAKEPCAYIRKRDVAFDLSGIYRSREMRTHKHQAAATE